MNYFLRFYRSGMNYSDYYLNIKTNYQGWFKNNVIHRNDDPTNYKLVNEYIEHPEKLLDFLNEKNLILIDIHIKDDKLSVKEIIMYFRTN
jgi:hypothetical protein